MARYFQGNTLASFARNQIDIVETTSSVWFDSAFVSQAILCPGTSANTGYAEARYNADATGNVWHHFEHRADFNPGTNNQWIVMLNSAGVPIFRLVASGSNIQAQVWSSGAWVNAGAAFVVGSTLNRFDLRYTPSTTAASFDFYAGGSLIASASGLTQTGITANVRSVRHYGWQNSVTCGFSQVLAADFDTRDSRYRQGTINGNGALTDGTGGFADINEALLDETTAIRLTAAAQRKTFTKAAITVPAGYRIGAVQVSGRARVTGALTNAQASLRIGGVNYDSANLSPAAAYEPRQNIWETNPATSGDWTQADFNGAEPGVEAI